MSSENAFADLMIRVQKGDADAAHEIFQRFARRLIGLARTRLDLRMRQKVDPEDVVQSVMKSFFRRQAGEAFDLRDWDSLWSLLTVLTLRKCGYRTRHFRALRRDINREMQPHVTDDSSPSWQAIAKDPSPSEAAMLEETMEELMDGLDERDRRIIEMSLQGYTGVEISAELSCSERTVQRLLARIKKKLERQGSESE